MARLPLLLCFVAAAAWAAAGAPGPDGVRQVRGRPVWTWEGGEAARPQQERRGRYCSLLTCTVLCWLLLYCTVLYCTSLYADSTVQYSTVQNCSVLYSCSFLTALHMAPSCALILAPSLTLRSALPFWRAGMHCPVHFTSGHFSMDMKTAEGAAGHHPVILPHGHRH